MSVTLRSTEEPMLSVSQAARLLGVSVSSLRVWAADGDLPHYRTTGGHRRFRRDDLEAWLVARGGELPDFHDAVVPRLVGTRVPGSADAARIATDHRVPVLAAAVRLLPDEIRTAACARHHPRIDPDQLLRAITVGLTTRDLSEGVGLVEWRAYRAGAAGREMDDPVAGVMALARALQREVEAAGAAPAAMRAVRGVCGRLVVAATTGYARGLDARREVADAA